MRLVTSEPSWAQMTDALPVNGGPGTGAAPDGSRAEREGWQAVIGGRLAEWENKPSLLEDEGVEAPLAETIQLATQMAKQLRDAGLPAPQRVAGTGDGGIVFTRQEGPLF